MIRYLIRTNKWNEISIPNFKEIIFFSIRQQMEVKVYKQKVKHLLYEQENHLAELKAESMVSPHH